MRCMRNARKLEPYTQIAQLCTRAHAQTMHARTENLTCTPTVYLDSAMMSDEQMGIGTNQTPDGERFFCLVCGKNYLRKRHLQRHMRDECIGIPPRFECEFCPSKFRRKYHLVRHLNSRHGDLITNEHSGIKVNHRIKGESNMQQLLMNNENDSDGHESSSPMPSTSTMTGDSLMSAAAMAAAAEFAATFQKDFSVDAIMMKREAGDGVAMPDLKLLEELRKKMNFPVSPDLFSTLRQMNPIQF